AGNVWVQPDDMDPDVGAVFDPLGNAVHTTLSFPLAGEDVLVTGAGPIGIMAAAVARHVGARYVVVTDISDYRLDLAKGAGADLAVNVARTTLACAKGSTSGWRCPAAPWPWRRCSPTSTTAPGWRCSGCRRVRTPSTGA